MQVLFKKHAQNVQPIEGDCVAELEARARDMIFNQGSSVTQNGHATWSSIHGVKLKIVCAQNMTGPVKIESRFSLAGMNLSRE